MKTVRINGINFTDIFPETGQTVNYIKRRGNASGTMLDGSYVDDVLAVKAVWSSPCMPVSETQLQQLLTTLRNPYVELYFFDPAILAYRTMVAMPGDLSQKYRGEGTDTLDYWTGTVVTLTEK